MDSTTESGALAARHRLTKVFPRVSAVLAFPPVELPFDGLPGDGREIPHVHADVTPGDVGQFPDPAVAVAVEVPSAVARRGPDHHAVVAHHLQ